MKTRGYNWYNLDLMDAFKRVNSIGVLSFIVAFVLTGGIAQNSFSQNFGLPKKVLNPVHWETPSYNVEEAAVGDIIEVIFTCKIDKGWYIYSSELSPDIGPNPTTVSFEKIIGAELVGGLKTIKPKTKFDEVWDADIQYCVDKAVFKQKLKIVGADVALEGWISAQPCQEHGQCLAPKEVDFTLPALPIVKKEVPKQKEETVSSVNQVAVTEVEPKRTASVENVRSVEECGALRETVDSLQEELRTVLQSEPRPETDSIKSDAIEIGTKEEGATKVKKPDFANAGTTGASGDGSLWLFMLTAFGFGLAAIFTPCVFPMIPLTVSFFTNKKGKGYAFFYGFSIVLIYSLIGAVVAPLAGPTTAQELSTHWLPNLIFFVVFVVFALSFFGMFEIVLPSSFVNAVDQKSEKSGGVLGVFFMAFTLVLVSFSCTGPIVGSILVASAGGEFIRPVAGMFAFSMAFALPFSIFAMFPSLMNGLPKSGGWLNAVKVVLGFIELAMAFKFLSMIDQVYHLGILDRDIFIAIWIAISVAMGLYLLGKIRLSHDSPIEHISAPRMLLALASFTFAIYLAPGMIGAPLKPLSGILPPQHTLEMDLYQLKAGGITKNVDVAPKHSERLKLPHGIFGYFDLEEAKAASRKEGKPIFIDFTGHGCVNCREMEANIWAKPKVLKYLTDKYIVVALYTDDRTELEESDWVISTYDGKVKKTIGKVNSDYQITKFSVNAMPYYVLMDADENVLASPIGYEKDVNVFAAFLNQGLENYKASR